MTRGKLDLSTGLSCAMAIYGRQYNPILTLQALSYFEDLQPALPIGVKTDLTNAVKAVSLHSLPEITASQKIGAVADDKSA